MDELELKCVFCDEDSEVSIIMFDRALNLCPECLVILHEQLDTILFGGTDGNTGSRPTRLHS